jgi:hypothetical protein
MGVGCQPHAPAASTPGKDPVPIVLNGREYLKNLSVDRRIRRKFCVEKSVRVLQ